MENLLPPPNNQKQTFKNVRRQIKVITVDSASDEVLSCEMMRSATLSGLQVRATPGLKYVVRDWTHASRRITSRGWGADNYLKEVITMFARGRGCMSRIIQNSPETQRIFKRYAKQTVRGVSNGLFYFSRLFFEIQKSDKDSSHL